MFKKTLLALAVAGVAGTASAASITATAVDISSEGFAAQAAAARIFELGTGNGDADVVDLTIDLDASLITNDVLEITFSGATIDTTNSTPILTRDATGVPDTDDLQFLDFQGTNTIRFRVSTDVAAVTGVEANDDDDLILSGVDLVPSSSADGAKVEVTSKAISSSSAIGEYEIVSTPVELGEFDAQLSVAATALDGTIDVAASRLLFTAAATSDALGIDLTDNAGDVDALTLSSVTHTIQMSDVSYLLDYDVASNGGDADGVLDQAEIDAAIVPVAATDDTYAVSVDQANNVVTIVQTVAGAVDDTTVTFNVTGDVAIPEQTFTASIVGTNGTNTATAAAAGTAIGSWSNNGSTFHVPALAVDSKHAIFVSAANRAALDADVELVMYVNGEAKSQGVVGTLGAYSQLNLSSAISAAAAAEGVSGIVSFDLVFEGANNNVDITAQYVNKTSGSRAVLQVTEL